MLVVPPVAALSLVLGRFLQVQFQPVQMSDGIETTPWFAERKTELPIVRNRPLKVVDEELRSKRRHTRLHQRLPFAVMAPAARPINWLAWYRPHQCPSEYTMSPSALNVPPHALDPNGLASASRATVGSGPDPPEDGAATVLTDLVGPHHHVGKCCHESFPCCRDRRAPMDGGPALTVSEPFSA